MIGALLLTAVLVPQAPGDLTLPLDLQRSSIELSIQATSTHFVATSYSDAPIMIFFGSPGSDLSTTVRIAPGAEVSYTFCRGCLDDVYIEVLSLRSEGWSNTGALPMSQVFTSAMNTMWIQAGGGTSIGWLAQEDDLQIAQPQESILPEALLGAHRELDDFSEPTHLMHVPVITPGTDKGGSKPPVIGPKPLPPV